MFGAKQQVPHPGAMLLTRDRQRGAIPLGVCEFGKTRCGGQHCRSFIALWRHEPR